MKLLGNKELISKRQLKDISRLFQELSNDEVKHSMYTRSLFPAPSAFSKASCLRKLGEYDESISYIED